MSQNFDIKFYTLLLLCTSALSFKLVQGMEDVALEEVLGPVIEHTVGTAVKFVKKKMSDRKDKKQETVAQESRDELKKIFLGELEYRVLELEAQLPTILKSSDVEDVLQEQLINMRKPFLQLITYPGFTLARGLTSTIFQNLFMYTKQLQQAFADDLEQMIMQRPLPTLEKFHNKIKNFKERITTTASQIISTIIAHIDPAQEGITASSTIKITRQQVKQLDTTFDEIVEGSVIALKPIQNQNYLAQEGGKIKVSSEYPHRDQMAQFLVERYGQAIGLKGKLGYVGINSETQEVFYAEQKFASTTQWIFEGQELGSFTIKNKKTGLMLAVGADATLMAVSQASAASRFTCSILGRPWNPPAYGHPLLKQLPAGTKIAFKIKGQGALDSSKYLAIDDKGFISPSGASSSDWRCQFDVMNFGNYVGFKQVGWKNICIDPVTWNVYVAQRSSMLFSATEQWVIDPDDKESLTSVRLMNRLSGGYVRLPTDWSNGRITTAGSRKSNPIKSFSSLTTLPEYIYEAATKDQALLLDIEIIKPAPRDIEPGQKSLSFVPAIHGKGTVLLSEQWKSSSSGAMTAVLSNIQAPASVFIALSDKPMATQNTVYILFGDEKNTQSGIKIFGSMAVSVTSKQNPETVITNPANESLWVRLKSNVVSFGKGTIIGSNQIASVQLEASVAKKLSYLGLGGGGNRVTFGSISIKKE